MSGFQWRKGIWATGILKKGNWSNSTAAKKTNKIMQHEKKNPYNNILTLARSRPEHANE